MEDTSKNNITCADKLKEMYPRNTHRVSVFKYEIGCSFGGIMRSGKCFAVSGQFSYKFGKNEVILEEGENALLPGGEYEFKVLGKKDVELVMVWKLPKEFSS